MCKEPGESRNGKVNANVQKDRVLWSKYERKEEARKRDATVEAKSSSPLMEGWKEQRGEEKRRCWLRAPIPLKANEMKEKVQAYTYDRVLWSRTKRNKSYKRTRKNTGPPNITRKKAGSSKWRPFFHIPSRLYATKINSGILFQIHKWDIANFQSTNAIKRNTLTSFSPLLSFQSLLKRW